MEGPQILHLTKEEGDWILDFLSFNMNEFVDVVNPNCCKFFIETMSSLFMKEQQVSVYANPIRTLFNHLVEIMYIGCTYLEENYSKN